MFEYSFAGQSIRLHKNKYDRPPPRRYIKADLFLIMDLMREKLKGRFWKTVFELNIS